MNYAVPPDLGFPIASLPTCIAGLVAPLTAWPAADRKAAVGMLFIPPEPSGSPHARIVLIRRSTKVGSHRGQVGFAGGRAEPGEGAPRETLLREMEEELGIERQRLFVLGALPARRSLDQSLVCPLVLAANIDPLTFRPSPSEVEGLILAPWPLLSAAKSEEFRFNIMGFWRTSYLYHLPETRVWGLTARIIQSAGLS